MRKLILLALILGELSLSAQSLITEFTSPTPVTGARYGFHGDFIDDLTGDGFPEVVIGEWQYGPTNIGRAYVQNGQTGGLITTITAPATSAGWFGISTENIGSDLTGDNINEVLICALENSSDGAVFVIDPTTGTSIRKIESSSPSTGGRFGHRMAMLDDHNGDGINEVVIAGHFQKRITGPFQEGLVHVFDPATGTELYRLESPNAETEGHFGRHVSSLMEDINGDGYTEFIVGASQEDTIASDAGRVYVYSGKDGILLYSIISPNAQEDGLFGWWTSGLGIDMDGDGYNDFAVSTYAEDKVVHDTLADAGAAYVFSGLDGSLIMELVPPQIEADGWYGDCVLGLLGDANGDGVYDITVNHSNAAEDTIADAGHIYVFSGTDGSLINTIVNPFPHPTIGSLFGYSMASTGQDLNGDGSVDFLAGSYHSTVGSLERAGRAFTLNSGVEPDTVCDASMPPTGLTATVTPSAVNLNWDAVPNSLGCELSGGAVPSFAGKIRLLNPEVNSFSIPTFILSPGNYNVRVRCVCQISPSIIATGFSTPAFFNITAPKLSADVTGLTLSPNPASDRLQISFETTVSEQVGIQVYDVMGQLVISQRQWAEGRLQLGVDVSELTPGTYFLEVTGDSFSETSQFEIIE